MAPLFASQEPLEMKMSFSIKDLRKNTNDSTYMDTSVEFKTEDGDWEQVDAEIRTRGNFRLDNCYYPPMRLKVKKRDREGTPFSGQKGLKVVFPCSKNKNALDFVGKEFLAYKLAEEVTPYYFPTRLIKITFVNGDDRKQEEQELIGFIIEDDDLVAERFGGSIYDEKRIGPSFMADTASVRHDMFQYMIGNTDWSSLFTHNQKIMRIGETTFVPLAYDFDMTGLVNPPYALVSDLVEIEKITDRLYRGFCRDPELMQHVRQEFLAKKDVIMSLAEKQLYLDDSDVRNINSFLKDFFRVLESDNFFKSEVLDKCRSY
ncbi:hypothetical protein [Algoriphagus sediminis]|uniref:Uncharacterized protein n=1 Tax=Algoriphagus sediminis TaxID=3057113 RepID=A0ABT7Y8B0_9BACT|nr:hypothetical protein [Algoriphagus sediminis]MDN3202762.1 hypothetical protein [Algoriphagus sediminis]